MRNAHRGFTLIELTIAVVLLAVGLLALAGALAGSLHRSAEARALHAALRAAEDVADSLAIIDPASDGALAAHGVAVSWVLVPCAPLTCARVSARVARDSITLLTVTGANEP